MDYPSQHEAFPKLIGDSQSYLTVRIVVHLQIW
jgi:hypothetical protein